MENKEIPGSNCIWTEFENVDKMDKSLEKYDLPTLRQDETKSLSRALSIKGIELTNKNISTENKKQKTTLGPDGSTGEIYQIFKEDIAQFVT